MCGILGVFSFNGKITDEAHRHFEVGLGLMYGRGPDGYWVYSDDRVLLGQAALLITDPKGGLRPYLSGDANIVACANGEIYNSAEVRAELESDRVDFCSESDCEVLGHGYRRWGDGLFERLDGMFGVAIVDRMRRTLTLARDKVGIRPLYYTVQRDYVAFASEARVLTASGLASTVPSDEGLYHSLVLRRPLDPLTVYRDVSSVIPGQLLHFDQQGRQSCRIFAALPPQASDPTVLTADETLDLNRVRDTVGWAIKRRIPERCNYSLFLSGGLDSTIVNAVCPPDPRKRLPSVVCGFSFDGMVDERKMAKQAADVLNIQLEQQSVSLERFLSIWPFIVWAHGEPLMFNSAIPLFSLCRSVREMGAKVILSGEGADEMFAGYAQYPAYADAVDDGSPEFLLRHDVEMNDPHHVSSTWLQDEAWGKSGWQALRTRIEQALPARGPRHGLARKLEFDRMTFMRGLLMRMDCVGLSTGIEVRVPFLDGRVIQTATRHAAQGHLRAGVGKQLLRQAYRDQLTPQLANVPKIGFPVPVSAWMKHAEFRRLAQVLNERLNGLPLFRKDAIANAIASASAEPRQGYKFLWTLLNISMWWSTLGEPPPPNGAWAELLPEGSANDVASLVRSTRHQFPVDSLRARLMKQEQPAVLFGWGWRSGAVHSLQAVATTNFMA
jgi:asparagine synthase (glutamine-hydrolysing)